MIIPWKVDVPQDRLPIANWLLIASIIGAFLLELPLLKANEKEVEKKEMEIFLKQRDPNYRDPNFIKSEFEKIKDPLDEYLFKSLTTKGLITHMWMHGGWMHLIGNMLFLWIFGNAVCSKLGNIFYFPIYIIVGIFAAVAFHSFSNVPMLGASGAINGIVGMYLVFFPINSITCYWSLNILYWKEFETSSYVMILLWFAYDIFGALLGIGPTAYFAHIGGFVSGFVIAIILLKTKLIKMTEYEKSLLDLIADARKIPERKEPANPQFAERFYPGPHQKPAEETTSDVRQAPQYNLSAEDFFNQSLVPPTPKPTNISDDFIRFFCACGQKIKVPGQLAGRTGKCPKCKQPVKIPKPE